MEKPVFLHVGLHKTGSGFWQQQVFPFLEGVHYVDRETIHQNDGFNKLMLADDSLYDPAEAQDFVDGLPDQPLLFSSESLSGKPQFYHAINRSMIARRLKDLFPNATIILFLRGQQEILWSMYNQYIKGRRDAAGRIEDFLWFPNKQEIDKAYFGRKTTKYKVYYDSSGFKLHLDVFKYKALIDVYQSLFDKVEVFLYEDFVQDPESVLERMLNIMEAHLSEGKTISFAKRENMGWSEQDISLKRRMNALKIPVHEPGERSHRSWLFWLGKLIPAKYPHLPKDYITYVTEGYYEESNRALLEAYPEVGIGRYPEAYWV
ncbi:MAG: hypothetical protein AAFV80_06840 [Bacteroidota bacterium]